MLTDDQLAATVICGEAANQPPEGRRAVGLVICNRVALPYSSDGTVAGACYHKFAFSELWSAMVHGHYQQIEFDLSGAQAEAQALFEQYSDQPIWDDCVAAWTDAQSWHWYISPEEGGPSPQAQGQAPPTLGFTPGPQFQKLTPKTVLYLNPAISSTAWATPQNEVAVIFDHTFYTDPSV